MMVAEVVIKVVVMIVLTVKVTIMAKVVMLVTMVVSPNSCISTQIISGVDASIMVIPSASNSVINCAFVMTSIFGTTSAFML